jgi:hypothetical protein
MFLSLSLLIALPSGAVAQTDSLDDTIRDLVERRFGNRLPSGEYALHQTVLADGRVVLHLPHETLSAHDRLALCKPDPARFAGAIAFATSCFASDMQGHSIDVARIGAKIFRPDEIAGWTWQYTCDDLDTTLQQLREETFLLREVMANDTAEPENWQLADIRVKARCLDAAPFLPFTRDRRASIADYRAFDLRPRRTSRDHLAITLVRAHV